MSHATKRTDGRTDGRTEAEGDGEGGSEGSRKKIGGDGRGRGRTTDGTTRTMAVAAPRREKGGEPPKIQGGLKGAQP